MSNLNGRAKFWLQVLAWVGSTIVAGMLMYTTVVSRIAVVEAKQEADEAWKTRVELKLDDILKRLPR